MTKFDVLTVGNAIVDIIARCDETLITDNGIIKGAMNLIDTKRAELLYSRMGPAIEASGGRVEHLTVGPGEDIFDLPDPAVCRIRAVWPRPNPRPTEDR